MVKNTNILIQKENEDILSFDKRVSELAYQHIGYAFFECSNYNTNNHTFSLYIVWNDCVNSRLEDAFPPTGFLIHCSEQIANCLLYENEGIPVFGKFISHNGIINVTELLIRFFDRNYVVSYTGVNAKIPDNIYFIKTEDVDMDKYNSVLDKSAVTNKSFGNKNSVTNKGSYNASFALGSYNAGSFNLGSFNIGSFRNRMLSMGSFVNGSFRVNRGSFNLGSFNLGSFNKGSFNVTSYNLGSFNLSSFSLSSFNLTSFNLGSFNWNTFNLSSFNLGSFRIGSFNIGSFNLGSYNISFGNNSSFKSGLFELGSYVLGSFNVNYSNSSYRNMLGSMNRSGSFANLSGSYNVLSDNAYYNEVAENYPFENLLKEIFGIGLMGYGLNLI